MMIQLLFVEVRVTPLAPSPVLVLRELNGVRQLGIWISASAAASILSALEAESHDHPSTHDLLLDVLAAQNAVVGSVTVLDVNDGLFAAQLAVNDSTIACRPSDGVALALRAGAPIYVSEELLAEHGVGPEEEAAGPERQTLEAHEVEQFREFLANVNADDFDEPEP